MIPPNYIQKQTLETMAQAQNVLQNALAEQAPDERNHTTPDRPITVPEGPPPLPPRRRRNMTVNANQDNANENNANQNIANLDDVMSDSDDDNTDMIIE